MFKPFVSLKVLPAYSQNSAVVSWKLMPGYGGAHVYVYKSPNGVTEWTCLNAGTPVIDSDTFLDNNVMVRKLHRLYHYRLLMRHGGKDYPSPIVAPYTNISREEYGAVFTMQRLEYLRMMAGNGVTVFHCTRLEHGDPLPGFDPETGQQLASDDCPNNPDGGTGTPIVGGYGKCWQTWIEFIQVGPRMQVTMEDGTGSKASKMDRARFLAYPRPRTDDVLINPFTDDRYIVGDKVQPFELRGICPIAYEAEISLLPRTDPRYRIPVPPVKPKGQVPMP